MAPEPAPEPASGPGAATRWEHFEHGADIGVRGVGPTPAAAFEQAALALTGVATDPAGVRGVEEVSIRCPGRELEPLLVDWLNALVYETATRRLLFGRTEVSLGPDGLEARAWGEPVDVARHQPAVEVKGATYTMLRVERGAGGSWVAECVVDV
ncbi:MAG TPA: archease [Candidatus Eisenbacteria bacterium]|nr:archease [Candidatus Eisenbacteria bacterium]